MKTLWTIVLVTAAACGSKTSHKTTPPPPGGDDAAVAMTEPPDAAPPEPTPDAAPPGPDPAQVKADLLAAEETAYESARPVFGKYCAGCHQQGGKKATAKKLGHFDITSYPFGGHHTGEMGPKIREVLGIGGGKATMPYDHPGKVKGDELALISAWADAWVAAETGGAHPAHDGHGDDDDDDHH